MKVEAFSCKKGLPMLLPAARILSFSSTTQRELRDSNKRPIYTNSFVCCFFQPSANQGPRVQSRNDLISVKGQYNPRIRIDKLSVIQL